MLTPMYTKHISTLIDNDNETMFSDIQFMYKGLK